MRIRYLGFGERVCYGYRWGADNGYVVEVGDVETAAELLTYPREGQFTVDGKEPLLQVTGIGQLTVVALAVLWVGSLEELAAFDEERMKWLAGEIWASVKVVRKWVREAGKILGREDVKREDVKREA